MKIHALLCRGLLKGRDWYDFNWYVRQGVSPNLAHLRNALIQFGPWQGRGDLDVNLTWLQQVLQQKIAEIDWREAAADVERFLPASELKSLALWSERFFTQKVSGIK